MNYPEAFSNSTSNSICLKSIVHFLYVPRNNIVARQYDTNQPTLQLIPSQLIDYSHDPQSVTYKHCCTANRWDATQNPSMAGPTPMASAASMGHATLLSVISAIQSNAIRWLNAFAVSRLVRLLYPGEWTVRPHFPPLGFA